jgi:hypothetical protein
MGRRVNHGDYFILNIIFKCIVVNVMYGDDFRMLHGNTSPGNEELC